MKTPPIRQEPLQSRVSHHRRRNIPQDQRVRNPSEIPLQPHRRQPRHSRDSGSRTPNQSQRPRQNRIIIRSNVTKRRKQNNTTQRQTHKINSVKINTSQKQKLNLLPTTNKLTSQNPHKMPPKIPRMPLGPPHILPKRPQQRPRRLPRSPQRRIINNLVTLLTSLTLWIGCWLLVLPLIIRITRL